MDLENMTIAEHEAAISTLSDERRALGAQMKTIHDSMEKKIKALPVVGGLGQVINPGTDWVAFLKQIPAEGLEALKKLLGK